MWNFSVSVQHSAQHSARPNTFERLKMKDLVACNSKLCTICLMSSDIPGGPDRWRVISICCGGRHSLVLALPDNEPSSLSSTRASRRTSCELHSLPPGEPLGLDRAGLGPNRNSDATVPLDDSAGESDGKISLQ